MESDSLQFKHNNVCETFDSMLRQDVLKGGTCGSGVEILLKEHKSGKVHKLVFWNEEDEGVILP